MNPSRLTPCAFTIDGMGAFVGVYDPNAPHPTPYFSCAVAEDIAAAYRARPSLDGEPAREGRYDKGKDAFRFLDPATNEWLEWTGVEVGGDHRYPIGNPEWTWERVHERVPAP